MTYARSRGRGFFVVGFLVALAAYPLEEAHADARFVRGDCNTDGQVDTSDAIFGFAHLFHLEEDPQCLDACDANDRDGFDISDGIYLLTHLFLDGGLLPPPFPDPGIDANDDDPLGCESYPPLASTGVLRIDRDESLLRVGESARIRVIAASDGGDEWDATMSAQIVSSDESVAQIVMDGDAAYVRGVTAGKAMITASLDGFDASTTPVEVRTPDATSETEPRSSISQYGITWTFDKAYPTGRFVNGDWWVVGPLEIVSVSPGWDGTHHGSMINPAFGARQGYDRRFNFDPGLRASFPRVVRPGESVVSAICWKTGERGAPTSNHTLKGVPRPALRTAAVLTVLASPPPSDAFRPSYSGSDKRIHRVSDLRLDLLPNVGAVGPVPSFGSLSARVSRPWLDHMDKWVTRYLCPSENLPNYGRDSAAVVNDAILAVMLDVPDETRMPLLIRVVQVGIDTHGVLATGGKWGAFGGGLGVGRKWPILFAGIVLDDDKMRGIGFSYPRMSNQEDCQTFFLTSDKASRYPGKKVGDPVWGEHGCWNPGAHYSDPGNTSYQWCCTGNTWAGAALGARLLDAVSLWNHPPFFAYVDWYMSQRPKGDWQRSWSDFAEAMWDRYR